MNILSENNHKMPPTFAISRWLFTTNHKDIGILYILTSLYFFVAGGSLALLIRLQLFFPNSNIIGVGAFNQIVTTHGLLMVLWFLSPLAFGFANYFVPIQIGAKDMAFPRLNAMSYWFFLFSGITVALSFFIGGAPDGGWTFYAPLSTAKYSPSFGLNIAAVGLLMLIASVTMGTVNFIVTILKMRAPGMKFKNIPMFTWSILLTVCMMLYAFPAVLAGVFVLFTDRAFGTIFLSSTEGGALLWDHIFWFFGHPEVYIVLFPGIGVVSEILPVFSRKSLFGKKYVVISLILGAVLSFLVWGHHMYVTGLNPIIAKLFTLTTELISLPFAVIFFCFLATLIGGKIKLKTPMLFALSAVVLFVYGGTTGIFLSSVAIDHTLRGTYWVVAHFHYTLLGGSGIALIGGLYYWYPKITGYMYNEMLGKIHFILAFVGFNLTFIPMFINYQMPRRISTYDIGSGWATTNFLSSVGGIIFGLSFLLMFYNMYSSLKNGKVAGDDPWNASTLEWSVSSPPPSHNFNSKPVYEKEMLKFSDNTETNNLHNISHISYWPILISLSTALFLLGFLLSLLTVTGKMVLVFGVGLGIISIYLYAREKFIVDHENSESWPFEKVNNTKLGIWVFISSEVIFFGSIVMAYMFIRLNSAIWPTPGEILSVMHGAVNTFILLTSSFTAIIALVGAQKKSYRTFFAF